MKKYFDQINNRLICVGEKADNLFWDKFWTEDAIRKAIRNNSADYLVCPETKRYLPKGSKILEGGCGTGKYVFRLNKLGYLATGIDSAGRTVSRIKKIFPGLPIITGNVLRTRFPAGSFDGYWSIGVIEHFYNGYGPLITEIKRLLKPGGYLFLTFPYLSPIRKIKIKLKMYSAFTGKRPADFYQFVLDPAKVIADFCGNGFSLVSRRPFDGWHGLREELGFKVKFVQLFVSFLALPWAAHSTLLVFRKDRND